jgi:hypothetical protein
MVSQSAAVLSHRVAGPSTLGTFLRAFTFGHVRQWPMAGRLVDPRGRRTLVRPLSTRGANVVPRFRFGRGKQQRAVLTPRRTLDRELVVPFVGPASRGW